MGEEVLLRTYILRDRHTNILISVRAASAEEACEKVGWGWGRPENEEEAPRAKGYGEDALKYNVVNRVEE